MTSRTVRKRLPLQDKTNAARNSTQPPQHVASKKRIRPAVEDLIDDGENTRPTRRRKAADARKSPAVNATAASPRPLSSASETRSAKPSAKARQSRVIRKSAAQHKADGEQVSTSADNELVLASSKQDDTVEEVLEQDFDHQVDSPDDTEQGHMFSFTGTILQATPLAAEMSARALKSFKRRPRQPSMLQMVRQRMESVDYTQTTRPTVPSDDLFDDIEDDFAPDLAGTPQPPTIVQTAVPRRSSKPGRDMTPSKQRTTRSNQRLKEETGHSSGTFSQSPVSDTSADFITAHDVECQTDDTQPQADEAVITSTEEQIPLPYDSVFADPVSQTTPSPPRGRRTRQKAKKVPSTADLQALLPRRRRAFSRDPSAARSVQRLDADEDSADDQSVSYSVTPVTRSVQKIARGPRTALKLHQRSNMESATQVQTLRQSIRHSTQKPRRQQGRTSEATTTRYDRQQSQAVTAGDGDSSLTEDLAVAKKKFAQIDEWELDFENITPEESSSPSQTYR